MHAWCLAMGAMASTSDHSVGTEVLCKGGHRGEIVLGAWRRKAGNEVCIVIDSEVHMGFPGEVGH